ncbi:MAG: hypothetical protein QF898_17715 [SAR202 cluster bacterium]|jgi:hypothetical protein|nr:hypothetical protein [SAR202 cluster bacterium]
MYVLEAFGESNQLHECIDLAQQVNGPVAADRMNDLMQVVMRLSKEDWSTLETIIEAALIGENLIGSDRIRHRILETLRNRISGPGDLT